MSRNNKSNLIKEIKVDDQIISSNNKVAEASNDYFIDIGPKLASDITRLSRNNVNTYLKLPVSDSPSFHAFYVYPSRKRFNDTKIFKSI